MCAWELGVFAIFQMIFRFSYAVFEPGMYASIIQKHDWSLSLQRVLTKYQRLILGLAISIILILNYRFLGNLDLSLLILILGVCLVGIIAHGSLYHTKLIYRNKQFEVSLLFTLAHIIEFIVLLVLLTFTNPLLSFACSLCTRFIVFYLGTFLLDRVIIMDDSRSSISESDHVKFGTHYCINQGLSYFQGIYDNILMLLSFGTAFMGIYVLACELSYFIFSKVNPLFNKSFYPVLTYKISKGEDTTNLIYSIFESLVLLTLPIYIFIYIERDHVLHWLYPDKASKMILIVGYFLMIAFIKSLNNILFTMILAYGHSRKILQWNIYVALVNYLVLFLCLVGRVDVEPFMQFSLFYSIGVFFFISYQLLRISRFNIKENLSSMLRVLTFVMLILIVVLFLSMITINWCLKGFIYVLIIIILLRIIHREKFNLFAKFKLM